MPSLNLGSVLRRRSGRRSLGVLLVAALLLLLPGRFLFEPTLLDSYAIRVKTELLSPTELFHPSQAELLNSFWRPLFHLLHAQVDRLAAGSDVGLRLLPLLAFAAVAFGMGRLARALGLPRAGTLPAVALFLVAPPNVTTASWPVAASWPLGVAITLHAAADLLAFAANGRRAQLWRGVGLVAVGLACSQAPWQLLPLLSAAHLAPPSARVHRTRLLVALSAALALVMVHLLLLERGAVTRGGGSLADWREALARMPRFLESGLGGDSLTGARPVAWLALATIALASWRDRRLRCLALMVLAAPLPFALVGHSDRYALHAHALAALALAAALPRVAATAFGGAVAGGRVARIVLPLPFVAVSLLQLPDRLSALRRCNAEARQIVAAVRDAAPQLGDLRSVRLVNAPPYLGVVAFHQALRHGASRWVALTNTPALRTRDGYFALAPLAESDGDAARLFEWDGTQLIARDPAAALGGRRLLPPLFLAGGFEVVEPRRGCGPLAEIEEETLLLDQIAERVAPFDAVTVEAPLPQLAPPLPRGALDWRIEPVALGAADRPAGRLFDEQIVATVDVSAAALLVVAVTWLQPPDPMRWVTGDAGRWTSFFEATIDGEPVPIVPVDRHLCGVVVPSGRHEVIVCGRPRREERDAAR